VVVRLREKGGKRKQIAVHHVLEEYMDAYLDAAGIRDDKTSPLFRTAYKKTGTLTERRMSQSDAWDMLQRRAKQAGITTAICNHSWRATGITTFLENGGAIEMAQYWPATPTRARRSSTTVAAERSPAARWSGYGMSGSSRRQAPRKGAPTRRGSDSCLLSYLARVYQRPMLGLSIA
jgi:hypothetical protein